MAECSALAAGGEPRSGPSEQGYGTKSSCLTFFLTVLLIAFKSLVLMVSLLVFIAYILYADRKVWAAVQLRRGPNVVGPWGLLQSFADLLKFVLKEPVIPAGANKGLFLLAPFILVVLALAGLGGDPGQ